MKVKCIAQYPTDQAIEKLGLFNKKQSFSVTIGKEYLVMGIAFHVNLPHFGTGVQIQFIDEDGNLAFAPLFIFEIIDGMPSKYWEAKFYGDGSFTLQPSSFYGQYYHDDLSNDVPEIVANFNRIRSLLEEEGNRAAP